MSAIADIPASNFTSVPNSTTWTMAASIHARVYIVTDCTDFKPPYIAGGTERQLSALASELGRAGHEITVVARECPVDTTTAEPPLREQSVPTVYIPPPPVPKGVGWAALAPNLSFIARTFWLVLRARRRYDVVSVSGFRQIAMPVALAAWIARRPCIIRIESAWDLDDELSPESNARIGGFAKRIASALIRLSRFLAFRLADVVVALSDPLETQITRLGAPRRKVKQIPNGVDVEQCAPIPAEAKTALRRRLGLPADRTIFIYTGRICRSKGLLELLATWERLASRADVLLLIVGSGAGSHESCEAEVLEMTARYPGAIEWRGAVDNVAEYLQAADVFVFLSYFEAFGLSMVEAAAAGLPSIVSDVGCARQVVRDHDDGAIVPPRAAPEVVLREIEWLEARRSEWAAMGARARARVVERYALEAVAHRYGELFDALCPAGRCRDVHAADNGVPNDRPRTSLSSAHVPRTPALDPLVRHPRRTPDGRPAPGAR
jgi:glycosyltransferase involved in cell wall biosynthesis